MPGRASYSAHTATASSPLPAAEVGPKRGVQAARGLGDRESAFGNQRLRLRAAAVFGKRQFRLGVDVV
jgi:hypothetical protein